jgi:hypothetical protein
VLVFLSHPCYVSLGFAPSCNLPFPVLPASVEIYSGGDYRPLGDLSKKKLQFAHYNLTIAEPNLNLNWSSIKLTVHKTI